MKTLKLISISLCAMILTVACSKSKDGTVATAAVTYYQSNGVCYDAKTNAQVASTNCNGLTYYMAGNNCYAQANHSITDMANCHALVGQYYYSNGSCYDKVARNYCAQSYCTNGAGASTGRYQWRNNYCIDTQTGYQAPNTSYCLNSGGNGQNCVESNRYLWRNSQGYGVPINCAVENCRGQTLWDQATNNYVNCAY